MPRPPHISPSEWMELTDAQRARWEEWENLSDEEQAEARAEVAMRRGEEWESDEERGQRLTQRLPETDADAADLHEEEWKALSQFLYAIHQELKSIRFRLGVLVFFIVILPFVFGFIVGFAVGFK